jgi:hypothetical protein
MESDKRTPQTPTEGSNQGKDQEDYSRDPEGQFEEWWPEEER